MKGYQLIAEGNTAEIFRLGNRIIKMYKSHLPETVAIYEASKQEFAYSSGLPVPNVLEVNQWKASTNNGIYTRNNIWGSSA